MNAEINTSQENVPVEAPPVQAPREEPPVKKPRKRRKALKRILVTVVTLAIVAVAAYFLLPVNQSQAADDTTEYIEYTVTRRDITVALSGSGTLQPADSYTVTSLVSGNILSAGFEEGDLVESGALLYEIDSSDLNTNIQKAENSLNQTKKSYDKKVKSLEDLNITASGDGTVIQLNVEEGDKVNAGQTVAVIRDIDTMQLTLPFITDVAAGFYVGQSALVTMDGTFEQLSGTISKISAIDELLGDSLPVRQVTIDVANPGGLSLTRTASAMVGDAACSGSGTFAYMEEAQVTAQVSGEVASVLTAEGGRVRKGDLIITLTSETLTDEVENAQSSIEDAQLSLSNQYDQLENYSITSPISGTIIEKHYKAGEKADSGKSLCVIFDLSYLTMTLNVDELDISKVSEGQTVTITAEAVEGKTYTGVVTRVNINGSTSGGVTTYPVTVRIDETDGLLPGMNVDAEIVVMNRENVLAVPVSAVSRGNRVLVKTDGSTVQDATQPGGDNGQMPSPPEGFEDGSMPSMPEGFTGFEDGSMPAFTPGEGSQSQKITAGSDGLPQGYEYITVTLGESDGSYIEVTQGLSPGDTIAYLPSQTTGTVDFQGGMDMMPGGSFTAAPMPGGGMRP